MVSTTRRHLRTKVLWNDGTISWCVADALRLQNPFIYIPYIYQRPNLIKHNDFKWVKSYINQQEGIKKLFKANRVQNKSSKIPKFKFGVHVPNNPRDAMTLNKLNNDNLWEGAMDKEIGSINTFKTFIILEEN